MVLIAFNVFSVETSFLMDCGCGSYEQMVRFFHDKVETELAKIKMIFISHVHLDHILVSDILIFDMQCIYLVLSLPRLIQLQNETLKYT